jgi:general secretion pathway protein C
MSVDVWLAQPDSKYINVSHNSNLATNKRTMNCQCKRMIKCEGEASLILLFHLGVGVLLLLWCVHSAWQLADVFQPSPAKIAPILTTGQADNASSSDASRKSVDIAVLKAIPLFGAEEVAPVVVAPVEEKEEELEETKLNLVLKGLFTSKNKESGQAIIANGRDDNLYQVGDEIEGLSKVSLLEVFADRVKLNNRGKAEVLYLYPEGERITSSQSPAGKQPSPFLEPSGSEQELLQNSEFNGTDDGAPAIKKLSQIIRVVRERDKSTGDMLGFRVLPGRDRAGFDKSGLQTNDIITAIDGDKLTDLRSAMTIYRNKRDAAQVSLMVSRQGSEVSIDIDLSILQ